MKLPAIQGKPERIRVSSFNYGRGQGWIDRSCEVTKMFGIEMSHWISLAETEVAPRSWTEFRGP